MSQWETLVHRAYNPKDEVLIGVVGKYVEYEDSYKSLKEALVHAALHYNLKLNLQWVEAEGLETKDKNDRSYESQLTGFDGILVPGGFGKRGIAGMLNAIRYAREHNVPYFGICLGMQTACIEFARNVCGLNEANSSEFDPATPHRVIYKLRELRGVEELGGTMRLGAWDCKLDPAPRPSKPTAKPKSANVTAIATNSTASTSSSSPAPDFASPAPRLTELTSRSSKFPITPTSWAASSIPNSSRSPWSRIRSS